jgi:hypothetical protein
MSDGYAASFHELLETTDWDRYGTGRDPRCADCMAHCGYEATAVLETLRRPREALRALAYSLGWFRGMVGRHDGEQARQRDGEAVRPQDATAEAPAQAPTSSDPPLFIPRDAVTLWEP